MQEPVGADEIKFGKSQRNRGTENAALAVLLQDPRFRWIDTVTKRRLLDLMGLEGDFGPQTFDAVMGDGPLPALDLANIGTVAAGIRLVEMKATKKPVRDRALNGFFCGATEREYNLARSLGDRFDFAFVVLNNDNVFGAPFFALLTIDELDARTKNRRVQFQVNLRTDTQADVTSRFGFGPAGLVRDPGPLDAGIR